MPELPEVETVRLGLSAVMEGRRINKILVCRSDLRKPIPQNFVEVLTGRTVINLQRRAKYLLIKFDDCTVLLIHLGMSGRMVIEQMTGNQTENFSNYPLNALGKHEHVIFSVGNGTIIRFIDPRRFGLMVLTTEGELRGHPLLSSIGPEPLEEEFHAPGLAGSLKGRRMPIKTALLDQRFVAGLGNIYVCESLFKAGLSPRRKAYTVQQNRAVRLVKAIKEVLIQAVAVGGSTIQDHISPSGEIGYFQNQLKVYGLEGAPCSVCQIPIKRIVQSGRSTFFCSGCQR
ncbi:MAG: bifunctional DNA-formamidopyrimidine glycosylase/DNA-(apurinic or apyrimidinic site) lyase [Pseudomonadota bacterium]|nr:bifunctional DNA-formamidopyrimidine glycosylase/DNA-(apurinic or apyrimidinic site) lyase [Pseudomonadota bacterium]